MADYTNRVVNPWVLHLQKLGLELKCPLCLELLNRPLLLPCDHIFCDSCVSRSQEDSDCSVCKSKYDKNDLREVRFMEGIISIYKSLNSAVTAHLSQLQQSANEYMCKNDTHNFCSTQKDDKPDGFEVVNKSVINCSGSHSHDSSPPSSQESNPRPKHKNMAVEMNQVEQLLLESPPSLDDAKNTDNDASDHTPEVYAGLNAKRMLDTYATEATENHLKDSKRQKKLLYGVCSDDCNDRSNQLSESLTTSGLTPTSANITQCGFCQSSRISEATGEMLHYCRGRQVVGDDIFRSNVIHVHRECLEWAPQAYYEADSVKNLKAELERGMKIKCTKCGLKGAALGCYVKSCRRSYHVPCAREIPKCRWDNDDFLLLCPAHCSVKFPIEKTKSGARISRAQPQPQPQPPSEITPIELSSTPNPSMVTKKLVLCGSALSPDERHQLEKLATKLGATISRFWNSTVTHVIASTDENGACTRTLKVLMGILHGRWILNVDWMKASFEASHPVDEEPYEINIDTQGCRDGPRTARLRAAAEAPKLLEGLKFFFFGDFVSGYKEQLQNLVKVAGGTILKTEDELLRNSCSTDQQSSVPSTFVIYNLDPPLGCVLGEEVSIIWQRANDAEALSSRTRSQLTGHTWLLESIAAYKLQPLIS